ncbi:hypothetical protein CQW23_34802 [Capsicum baccatum]|uniref:Protein TAR1 n=1 Tax=Capsicum baccatum TaxID=33114 RepID=A0A2G2UXZ3_CAPBA|nr:hypothetical protein CQW23_34802 [Capsicum baccatum]
MVHGILQFTPSIAFRYVLHRCESRDIRCRESFVFTEEARVPPTHAADGARGAGCRFEHSLALSAPGFVGRPPRAPGRARRGRGGGARAECRSTPPARAPRLLNAFAGSFCCAGFDNDPSAGSPTETFQRLDGSRDSAIHTKYRISQPSSSMREPRYPLPRVVFVYRRSTGPPDARRGRGTRGRLSIQVFHGATVPWYLGAMAPRCLGALVPWRHGALMPWCLGAMAPRSHGALVPCPHGALVPWRHGAKLPWCHGARISNLTKTPPWQATMHPSAFVIGGVSSIALDGHKNH